LDELLLKQIAAWLPCNDPQCLAACARHKCGAESREPINWVTVGGLALGTLFILFVIPTAYTLLARPVATEQETMKQSMFASDKAA
jgi:hypothetical protein